MLPMVPVVADSSLMNEKRKDTFLVEPKRGTVVTVVEPRHKRGGSPMRKMQQPIIRGKEIFVGLGDHTRPVESSAWRTEKNT